MEATITASLGAMRSLPSKLDRLLSERKLVLHNGEKSSLCILKGDLEVFIEKYLMEPSSEVGDPAFTTNYWLKEVRELSYDIDDFVDKLLHGAATAAAHAKNPKVRLKASKFLAQKRPKIWNPLVPLVVPPVIAVASAAVDAKMASRLQDRKKRRWIASEVSTFMARIKEVIQLHKSYIKSKVRQPGWCSDETLSVLPLAEESSLEKKLAEETGRDLVGIDKNMDKLSCWLVDDGQLECKVIAIVGPGGVGKTTLAKELFQKFGWQFECQAFIRASRKLNMKMVLFNILTQVGHHKPPINLEVDNLVDEIKSYLEDKRYFIIIDDVWTLSTWDTINRALPKSNCSRIVITTEVYHVAQISCADNSKYIFKKEPLDEDESNKLFLHRAFSHKPKRVEHIKEISSELSTHLCGGLPLAIIATASILARLPDSMEQWNDLENSLGSNLGTEQVLNIVYNTLPNPLKACMLYFSIYEEDYIILKDDLVKQWVDEGFIGAMDENDKEEIAIGYFYEFVNMGIIQPVQISSNDEVLSCTTHYMVLDFIRNKSIEENFCIAIDHTQIAIRLSNKVRRLSLHFDNGEDATMPTYLRLSQVRTLAFFGLFNYPLPIVEFRFLQVLILQLSVGHDDISYDLTEISELFRLRYLYISACHLNIKLPIEMQGLKDLVTLKIEAKLSTVPSDIVDLPRILHLYLPSEANLPHDIDHMTSLRTLGYFDLSSNSRKIIMNLGKLTNLQDLYLTCSMSQLDTLKDNMKCLCSFLEKLNKLRSLTLVCTGSPYGITTDKIDASSMGISCDDFSVISPLPFLRRFELSRRSCILARLPKWIKVLAYLRILKIAVSKLSRHDIHILSELPTLATISLYIQAALEEMIVFGNAGFSNLRCFKFRCSVPWLKFEANAMPSLQKLKLKFNASFNLYRSDTDGTKSISIEHLSGLKEIFAKVGNADASVESDLMATISNDPSNPTITFQMVDNIFYGDTSNGMRTKHDKGSTLGQQDTIVEEGPIESYRTQDDEQKDQQREVDDSRISMVEAGLCSNPSPPLPQRRSGQNIPWLLPVCGGVRPTSKAPIVGHDHVNCHTGDLSIAVVQANKSLNYQSCVESLQALGTMIGIFDGYGGFEAAKFTCDHLFPHLQDIIMSSSQGATIDAISKAFKATEEGFIELVSQKWKTNPQMAATGSCCLVGIMQQKTLFIANLGNSQAVLGKVSCTGEIFAEQLSSEHIASDAGIRHELMVAHPDDPDIVVHTQSGWRVKGIIKVSRSIGDAYLKHPEYNELSRPFRSPILSANPSIVSRNLQPSDRFIIFASAGLWEYLNHQEAVEIVRNHERSGSAKRLINIALRAAAKKHNWRYSDLLKKDKDDHRHLYDDMTVVVLFIDHARLRKGGRGQPLSIRYP